MQLAKGSVEDCKVKGHNLCLKITSTLDGEKCIYLSFLEIQDYNRWYRKCKKVSDVTRTKYNYEVVHFGLVLI